MSDERRAQVIRCVETLGMTMAKTARIMEMKYNTVVTVMRRFHEDGIINRSQQAKKKRASRFTFEMQAFVCACFLRCTKTSAKAVAWMFNFVFHDSISESKVRQLRHHGRIALKALRQPSTSAFWLHA